MNTNKNIKNRSSNRYSFLKWILSFGLQIKTFIQSRFFWYFFPLLVVLGITFIFLSLDYQTIKEGNTVFIPLQKDNPVTLTSAGIEVNYKQILPDKQVIKAKHNGKVVIYVNSFGVGSFVRHYDPKDKTKNTLKFGEHLLNYKLFFVPSLSQNKYKKVYFASRLLPYLGQDKQTLGELYGKARYAVLRLSPSGHAILVGLASRNYNFLHL